MTARVVGFLGLVYFTRLLPQSELGVYFLFFLVVQVVTMVGTLGMGSAIIQRIGSTQRTSEMYSAAVLVILGVAALIAIVVHLPPVQTAIAGYVGTDVPLLISLAIATWMLADIHIRAVQAEDRVLLNGLLQLLQDLGRVLAGAAFLWLDFGAVGLMYGVIIGFVLTTVVGLVVTDLRPVVPARRDFVSLVGISRYTAFFGPTNFVYFWFDTFMIGLLLTRSDVSAYEVAWQTTRVLIIPTTAIRQTIYPKISRWASEGAQDEIERVLPGAIIFTLIIPLPGLVGLLILGPDILSLVYRPSYAVAAIPLAILGGYMVLEALHRVGEVVCVGMDRADIPFRTRLVGVSLAVVLNVILIPLYGLPGAAVATLTAKLVDAAGLWFGIGRLVEVNLPVRSLVWQVFSAGLMGLAVLGVGTLLGPLSLPTLLLLVGAGAALYSLAVLLDPDIRQVLGQYLPLPVS